MRVQVTVVRGKLEMVRSFQRDLEAFITEQESKVLHEMRGLRQEMSRQSGIDDFKLEGVEDGLAFVRARCNARAVLCCPALPNTFAPGGSPQLMCTVYV